MTRIGIGPNNPALTASTPTNTFAQSLFQPVGKRSPNATDPGAPVDPIVKEGSLITFNYLFRKRDPYPMVIVTRIKQGERIKGINLNYLTFFDIRRLIQAWGDKTAFSYQAIKGDKSIVDLGFREYKWDGIRQVKKFNAQFLLQVITLSKTFDINQVQIMRNAIKAQLRQVNIQAKQMKEGKSLYTPEAPPPSSEQAGAFPNAPTIAAKAPLGSMETNQ